MCVPQAQESELISGSVRRSHSGAEYELPKSDTGVSPSPSDGNGAYNADRWCRMTPGLPAGIPQSEKLHDSARQ